MGKNVLSKSASFATPRSMNEKETYLLDWFNKELETAGFSKRITNFTTDLSDCECYIRLFHHLAPELVSLQDVAYVLDKSNLGARAELLIDFAEKLGVKEFISAADIVAATKNLNLAFVAVIYNTYSRAAKKRNAKSNGKKNAQQVENKSSSSSSSKAVNAGDKDKTMSRSNTTDLGAVAQELQSHQQQQQQPVPEALQRRASRNLVDAFETLTSENTSLRNKMATLSVQLDTAQSHLDEKTRVIKHLEDESTTLKLSLEAKDAEVQSLKRSTAISSSDVTTEIQKKLSDALKKMEQLAKENDDLKIALAEKDSEVRSTQAKLNQVTIDLETQMQISEKTEKRYTNLLRENEHKLDTTSELIRVAASEIDQINKEKSLLAEKTETQVKELATKQDELTKVSDQLRKANLKIDSLEQEQQRIISDHRAQLRNLEANFTETSQRLESAGDSKSMLLKDNEALRTMLKAKESSMAETVRSWNSRLKTAVSKSGGKPGSRLMPSRSNGSMLDLTANGSAPSSPPSTPANMLRKEISDFESALGLAENVMFDRKVLLEEFTMKDRQVEDLLNRMRTSLSVHDNLDAEALFKKVRDWDDNLDSALEVVETSLREVSVITSIVGVSTLKGSRSLHTTEFALHDSDSESASSPRAKKNFGTKVNKIRQQAATLISKLNSIRSELRDKEENERDRKHLMALLKSKLAEAKQQCNTTQKQLGLSATETEIVNQSIPDLTIDGVDDLQKLVDEVQFLSQTVKLVSKKFSETQSTLNNYSEREGDIAAEQEKEAKVIGELKSAAENLRQKLLILGVYSDGVVLDQKQVEKVFGNNFVVNMDGAVEEIGQIETAVETTSQFGRSTAKSKSRVSLMEVVKYFAGTLFGVLQQNVSRKMEINVLFKTNEALINQLTALGKQITDLSKSTQGFRSGSAKTKDLGELQSQLNAITTSLQDIEVTQLGNSVQLSSYRGSAQLHQSLTDSNDVLASLAKSVQHCVSEMEALASRISDNERDSKSQFDVGHASIDKLIRLQNGAYFFVELVSQQLAAFNNSLLETATQYQLDAEKKEKFINMQRDHSSHANILKSSTASLRATILAKSNRDVRTSLMDANGFEEQLTAVHNWVKTMFASYNAMQEIIIPQFSEYAQYQKTLMATLDKAQDQLNDGSQEALSDSSLSTTNASSVDAGVNLINGLVSRCTNLQQRNAQLSETTNLQEQKRQKAIQTLIDFTLSFSENLTALHAMTRTISSNESANISFDREEVSKLEEVTEKLVNGMDTFRKENVIPLQEIDKEFASELGAIVSKLSVPLKAVTAMSAKATSLMDRIEALQRKETEIQGIVEDLNQQVREKESVVSLTKGQLQSREGELASQVTDLKMHLSDREFELQTVKDNMRQAERRHQEEMTTLKDNYEDKVRECVQEIDELVKRIQKAETDAAEQVNELRTKLEQEESKHIADVMSLHRSVNETHIEYESDLKAKMEKIKALEYCLKSSLSRIVEPFVQSEFNVDELIGDAVHKASRSPQIQPEIFTDAFETVAAGVAKILHELRDVDGQLASFAEAISHERQINIQLPASNRKLSDIKHILEALYRENGKMLKDLYNASKATQDRALMQENMSNVLSVIESNMTSVLSSLPADLTEASRTILALDVESVKDASFKAYIQKVQNISAQAFGLLAETRNQNKRLEKDLEAVRVEKNELSKQVTELVERRNNFSNHVSTSVNEFVSKLQYLLLTLGISMKNVAFDSSHDLHEDAGSIDAAKKLAPSSEAHRALVSLSKLMKLLEVNLSNVTSNARSLIQTTEEMGIRFEQFNNPALSACVQISDRIRTFESIPEQLGLIAQWVASVSALFEGNALDVNVFSKRQLASNNDERVTELQQSFSKISSTVGRMRTDLSEVKTQRTNLMDTLNLIEFENARIVKVCEKLNTSIYAEVNKVVSNNGSNTQASVDALLQTLNSQQGIVASLLEEVGKVSKEILQIKSTYVGEMNQSKSKIGALMGQMDLVSTELRLVESEYSKSIAINKERLETVKEFFNFVCQLKPRLNLQGPVVISNSPTVESDYGPSPSSINSLRMYLSQVLEELKLTNDSVQKQLKELSENVEVKEDRENLYYWSLINLKDTIVNGIARFDNAAAKREDVEGDSPPGSINMNVTETIESLHQTVSSLWEKVNGNRQKLETDVKDLKAQLFNKQSFERELQLQFNGMMVSWIRRLQKMNPAKKELLEFSRYDQSSAHTTITFSQHMDDVLNDTNATMTLYRERLSNARVVAQNIAASQKSIFALYSNLKKDVNNMTGQMRRVTLETQDQIHRAFMNHVQNQLLLKQKVQKANWETEDLQSRFDKQAESMKDTNMEFVSLIQLLNSRLHSITTQLNSKAVSVDVVLEELINSKQKEITPLKVSKTAQKLDALLHFVEEEVTRHCRQTSDLSKTLQSQEKQLEGLQHIEVSVKEELGKFKDIMLAGLTETKATIESSGLTEESKNSSFAASKLGFVEKLKNVHGVDNSFVAAVEDLGNCISKMRERVFKLESSVDEKENAVRSMSQENTRMKNSMSLMEKQLDEAELAKRKIHADYHKAIQQNNELREKLEQVSHGLDSERSQKSNKVKDLQSEANTLKMQIEEMNSSLEGAVKDFDKLSLEKASIEKQWREKLAEADEERDRLANEVSRLTATVKRLKEENSKTYQVFEETKAEKEMLAEKRSELEAKLSVMEKYQREQKERVSNQHSTIESKLEANRKELKELRTQLHVSDKYCTEMRQAIDIVVEKIKQVIKDTPFCTPQSSSNSVDDEDNTRHGADAKHGTEDVSTKLHILTNCVNRLLHGYSNLVVNVDSLKGKESRLLEERNGLRVRLEGLESLVKLYQESYTERPTGAASNQTNTSSAALMTRIGRMKADLTSLRDKIVDKRDRAPSDEELSVLSSRVDLFGRTKGNTSGSVLALGRDENMKKSQSMDRLKQSLSGFKSLAKSKEIGLSKSRSLDFNEVQFS